MRYHEHPRQRSAASSHPAPSSMCLRIPTVDSHHGIAVQMPGGDAHSDFVVTCGWVLLAYSGLDHAADEIDRLENQPQLLPGAHLSVEIEKDLERGRVGVGVEIAALSVARA